MMLLIIFIVQVHQNVWTCDNIAPGANWETGCDWDIRGNIRSKENSEGVADPAGNDGNAIRVFYPEVRIHYTYYD